MKKLLFITLLFSSLQPALMQGAACPDPGAGAAAAAADEASEREAQLLRELQEAIRENRSGDAIIFYAIHFANKRLDNHLSEKEKKTLYGWIRRDLVYELIQGPDGTTYSRGPSGYLKELAFP